MNADRLLAHYEKIAGTPDAIARLRRFILDLAVRGKLVPQDPSDEPASELLRRIAAEKERLVKAGTIKKPKALSPVDAPPFGLPRTWLWARIRQTSSDRGQKIPEADFTYIDVTSIDKEKGVVANPRVVPVNEAPSRARKIVRKGDVVYSCVRPYLLNVAIVEKAFDPPPIASTAFAVLDGHGFVLSRFQWIVLRSTFMVTCVEEEMRGQAYPAINDADFARLPFPLPPLAEQRRIVARVDELMELCDRLEAARAEQDRTRDRLTATSLARLDSPDPDREIFQSHAAFVFKNFIPLTTRPDQIQALRRTILNLAVRGKLVEQDPNDEPPSELLKRIAEEKKRLVKAGKMRKPKLFPNVFVEPFVVPNSWCWLHLGEAGLTQTGTTPTKSQPEYYGSDIPFIKPNDLHPTHVDYSNEGLSRVGAAVSGRVARRDSVLMVCIGTIGKCQIIDRSCSFNQQINAVSPYADTDSRFVLYSLRSDYFQDAAWAASARTTIAILNKGNWERLLIPLPPLAEQRRIVAKVDELMILWDRLEASLTTGDDARRRLFDALLHEALRPDGEPLRPVFESKPKIL